MPDKDGWKKVAAAMARREAGETMELVIEEPVFVGPEETARRMAELRRKYVTPRGEA